MSSIDVSVALIESIVHNMMAPGDDWSSVAVVIDVNNGALPATQTAGFLYSDTAFLRPVAVGAYQIGPAVRAYMESYFSEGESWPVKILVQFEQTTGRYQVLFEETDTERWELKPGVRDEVREEIRPVFD